MRAFHLTQPDAFVRYHDLPGTEPARVYLAGLGWPAAAGYAHIVADAALSGRRSLLIDCLGFGLSDRPPDFSYTLDAHAEVVVALLDHLALATYDLIGHSFGGSVAVLVAARRPERVATLVVADPNLDPGGGAFSAGIAAQTEEAYVGRGHAELLARLRDATLADADQTRACMAGVVQIADPRALHRSACSLVEMPPPTVRQCLLGLHMRRVLLVGAHTLEAEAASGSPADWPYAAGLAAAGVRVSVVPDAGHAMVWDNPAGFARVTAQALTTQ